MEHDTHTFLCLDWFRQSHCEVNSITGKMTFHKDDHMTAYQIILPEDENEIQTYVFEVDEEELMSLQVGKMNQKHRFKLTTIIYQNLKKLIL